MAGELEWSEGEPAINVYSAGGGFGTHKDHMALTVLIPLTAPATDFSGGGTGFWSALDEEMMGGVPSGSPTKVLKPPIGTALMCVYADARTLGWLCHRLASLTDQEQSEDV